MSEDKNKIKEPFNPEDTPSPPQIIDPEHSGQGGELIEEVNKSNDKKDSNNKAQQGVRKK